MHANTPPRPPNTPGAYNLSSPGAYPDEGHGFARPENQLQFFAIMEQFLAQHLGGRAEPVGEIKGSTGEMK